MVEGSGSFSYVLVPSSLGTFSVVCRRSGGNERVARLFLPRPGTSALALARAAFPGIEPAPTARMSGWGSPAAQLAAQVTRFLAGEAIVFDLAALEDVLVLDGCSRFQRRVLHAESRIPRGRVSTYGRIAETLGTPRAARAVGRALAQNPFPVIVPCHRAILSDGRLGGFQGGVEMKRALLALEGVEVTAGGRVAKDVFYL